MLDTYEQLAAALAEVGIYCYLQSPDQLVVSDQLGPPWPNRGNSFWMTRATGVWHLFTWSSVGYFVPQIDDIASLCRACMAHGTNAMWEVPSDIVKQFALRELSEVDVEDIFARMAKPA
jgi:hypothetical protein